MPIKILLIDDHTLFRSGLRFLLENQPNFEIIGEASDGLEGIKLAKQVNPDIILLDLDMPVMNGVETLAQLLHINPEFNTLILTVSEDSDDLAQCMKIGAKGYLLKNIDTDFLIESIYKTMDGNGILSPEMTSKLIHQIRINKTCDDNKKTHLLEKLTPREKETLIYLSSGASNKKIAKEMNLTESTIKVHVQNILRKLKLNSRVQAAVYAIEKGITDKKNY